MTGRAIRVRIEKRCEWCLGEVRLSYTGAPTPFWCPQCRQHVHRKDVRVPETADRAQGLREYEAWARS